MATRTILVDQHFFPAAASTSPILRGVTALPTLDGYVAVTPKARAEVVLVSPDGDPVLSAWQYGAGRALAWTPDLGNRWAPAWQNSAATVALWSNAFSWVLPTPESSELRVRAEKVDERSVAIVAENRAAWDEVRPTTATVIGPGGQSQTLEMQPAGPGRYRGELNTPEIGGYILQADQALPAGSVHAEAGWVAPYAAEYRQVGVDRATLTRIAAAGGGRVLASADEAMRPPDAPAAVRWPAAGLLLVLAALFWPLEIASRRLAVPEGAAAALSNRLRLPQAPFAGRSAAHTNGHVPSPSGAATADRLLRRKAAFRKEQR
jgi:hypothetical protein